MDSAMSLIVECVSATHIVGENDFGDLGQRAIGVEGGGIVDTNNNRYEIRSQCSALLFLPPVSG